MKRLIICLVVLISCFGCSSSKTETKDSHYKQYTNTIKKLNKNKNFSNETPDFSVRVVTNITNKNNIRYDLIIDSPKVEMKNIKALSKVEDQSENFPSIGLLEKEVFNLKPNYVDKAKNYYKGINLSGITNKNGFVLYLYVSYKTNNKTVERYLKLNVDEIR